MNENENKASRKERIKTILIIFLAVLLVLTFCSNTIMNYSLPIVAAQYASSGTITEQVRASGLVTANQTYEIVAEGTRVVESIAFKPGDKIKAGETFCVLEAGGDAEVKAAETMLRDAEIAYQKALLTAVPDYAVQNQDIANARQDLQDAIDKLNAARNQGGITKLQYDIARNAVTESTNKIAAVQGWQAALESGNYAALHESVRSGMETYKAALDAAAAETAEAQAAYDAAAAKITVSSAAQTLTVQNLERIAAEKETAYLRAKEDYEASDSDLTLRRAMEDAETAWQYAQQDAQAAADVLDEIVVLEQEAEQAATWLRGRQSAQAAAQEKFDSYYAEASASFAEMIAEYTIEMQNASQTVSAYEGQNMADLSALEEQVKMQERNLQSLLLALTETKKNDALTQEMNRLDLQSQQDAIDKQRTELEELRKNSGTLTVISKHDGVVSSVNYAAGETVMDGETIAVVTLTDSGYAMQCRVSAEQARILKIGMEAETNDSYNGTKAFLQSIKADIENPNSTDRVLTFLIEGRNVTVGQSLSVSVTGSSAMYDCVVPCSAIMEDSDGKFVMTVQVKSTPLGNRYTARRVGVTIQASDEIYCAVQGELSRNEYVITASESPLKNGMQIRMED